MLKENKGITLIALIITIIVLIIIAAIGVRAGRESIRVSKDNRLLTELDMVQHAVFERYSKYKLINDKSYLVGTQITYSEAKSTADKMKVVLPENLAYYKLTPTDLKSLGLEQSEYVYIVNYANGIVMNATEPETNTGEALYTDSGAIRTADATDNYVKDGLILHYDGLNNTGSGHDNTATTWYDLSKNGNHATLTGFENTTESGWSDDGLVCNGTNNKFLNSTINLEENTSLTVSNTICLNKYVTFYSSNHCILTSMSGWRNFVFHLWYGNSSTKLIDGRIYIGGNYTEGGETCRFEPSEMANYKMQLGKKDNIVYNYDGQTKIAKLYINSELIASETHTAGHRGIQDIKSGIGNNITYYNIKVYNRALTDAEVEQNYNEDKTRFGL